MGPRLLAGALALCISGAAMWITWTLASEAERSEVVALSAVQLESAVHGLRNQISKEALGFDADPDEISRLEDEVTAQLGLVTPALERPRATALTQDIERYTALTARSQFASLEADLFGELASIRSEARSVALSASERARVGVVLTALAGFVAVMAVLFAHGRGQRTRVATAVSERYEALVNDSPDLIFLIEQDGNVSWTSPAAGRLSDPPPRHLDDLIRRMPADVGAAFRDYVQSPHTAPAGLVVPIRATADDTRWVELRLSDQRDNRAVGAVVATGQDVTTNVHLQQELARQADEDELTGLANRRLLNRSVTAALARADRSGTQVALILLDLDGFKGVNDTLGHPVGDELLRQVADRLEAKVRSGEMVARLGGDEFAVVVEGVDSTEQALAAANRFAMVLHTAFDVGDQVLALKSTSGVALSAEDIDGDELFRRADIALYEGKHAGRGRTVVFEPRMEELLVGQARLQRELENGLRHHEFELVYQPLVDVVTRRPRSFEALMRWHSPSLGTVPPLTFIPVAEQSGFIVELGEWALREAITQLLAWKRDGADPELSMSVNVSVVQLMSDEFVPMLRSVLDDTGIDPRYLQIEVTESVFADELDRLVAKLDAVRRFGVRVALDDFGTGYSSMGQLQALPVDCIKVDRAFVEAVRRDEGAGRGLSVIQALFDLGRALGLEVVAEGIEELSQLDALAGPNLDTAQGYLFSRPLPRSAVPAYLAGESSLAATPRSG